MASFELDCFAVRVRIGQHLQFLNSHQCRLKSFGGRMQEIFRGTPLTKLKLYLSKDLKFQKI